MLLLPEMQDVGNLKPQWQPHLWSWHCPVFLILSSTKRSGKVDAVFLPVLHWK